MEYPSHCISCLFFENMRSTCFIKKKVEGLHVQCATSEGVEHEHKAPLSGGAHAIVTN
jgi:hypothetical protein